MFKSIIVILTTAICNLMQLVFATSNLNKLKEVQSLIPTSIKLLNLTDIGCDDDLPETQNTIEGNAMQKVEYLKLNYGYDCFADDTGLEVEALDGEPGVFSARYAGVHRSAEANMEKLLNNLKGHTNRKAQFKTVIALHLYGSLYTFTGICTGSITTINQGEGGFGYDPIFKPDGHEQTFAEMRLDEKNKIGHRGKAVRQLVEFLSKRS